MFCSKTFIIIFLAAIFLGLSSATRFRRILRWPGSETRLEVRANTTSHSYHRSKLRYRSTVPDGYFMKNIFNETTQSFNFFGLVNGVVKYIQRCDNGHVISKSPNLARMDDGANHSVALGERHADDGVVIKVNLVRNQYPVAEFYCNVTSIDTTGGGDDYNAMYQDLLLTETIPLSEAAIFYHESLVPYDMTIVHIPEGVLPTSG